MNGVMQQQVPVVAEFLVQSGAADIDARHQGAIRLGQDLVEGLMEDMTLESVAYLSSLIDQIRVDLAYCRSGLLVQEAMPAV
jgi:hypothetical protein